MPKLRGKIVMGPVDEEGYVIRFTRINFQVNVHIAPYTFSVKLSDYTL
jgi:hypothetical protein